MYAMHFGNYRASARQLQIRWQHAVQLRAGLTVGFMIMAFNLGVLDGHQNNRHFDGSQWIIVGMFYYMVCVMAAGASGSMFVPQAFPVGWAVGITRWQRWSRPLVAITSTMALLGIGLIAAFSQSAGTAVVTIMITGLIGAAITYMIQRPLPALSRYGVTF